MAGNSSITLFRTEDSTISIAVQTREGAKVVPYDLTSMTTRLMLRQYPDTTVILQIDNGDTDVGSGSTFSYIDDALGTAALIIKKEFWSGKTNGRYSIEAFIIAASFTQRLGETLFDVTE